MKNYRRSFIYCILFQFCVFAAANADLISPTATIKDPIGQIVGLLNDPQYKSPGKRVDQRKEIWKIARPMFDADTLSKRVIGRPWESFGAEEKSKFTEVFARFLGTIFIEKMQGEYSNVKINFNKELIKGDRALVRTVIKREDMNIAMDYLLKMTSGQWKIYDVVVDKDISLVKSYRVQFSSILKKETPAQLIKRLEQKLADQNILATDEPSSKPPAGKGK